MLRRTPQDFWEMACNSSGLRLPAPGMFRSITYLGMAGILQYGPMNRLGIVAAAREVWEGRDRGMKCVSENCPVTTPLLDAQRFHGLDAGGPPRRNEPRQRRRC